MNKYKLEVYFETEGVFDTVDECLEGSPLMDTDFRGVITSARLKERK